MDLALMSLFDLIKLKGWLSESSAHYIFQNILQAVSFVHEKGFSHWDIKLENILLTSEYEVKLIDFGFCTNIIKSSAYGVGTDMYNPPEYFSCIPYFNQ